MAKIALEDGFISVVTSVMNLVGNEQQALTFNNDVIYARGFGGSLAVVYNPGTEITDEEFSVFDPKEFFKLFSFLDEESRQIDLKENVLIMKDNMKQIMYLTSPRDRAPEMDQSSMDKINDSKDVKAGFIIDDELIDEVKKTLSVMSLTDAFICSTEDNKLYFSFYNEGTQNSIDLNLTKDHICKVPNMKLKLPTPDFVKSIYHGLYKCQIKSVEINGNEFSVLVVTNTSLEENEGKLTYIAILEDQS